MTAVVLACVAAAVAAWLALPGSSDRLSGLLRAPRTGQAARLPGRAGSPPLRQRVAVGAGAALVLALLVDGWVGWVAGLLAGAVTVVALGFAAPATDWRTLADELPDALDFMAVCLDAGLPTVHAVEQVAEVSPSSTRTLLREVAAQLALGRAGPAAWEGLRVHPVWGRAAADVIRAERAGTALAGVLRTHAEDARQDARDRAAKRARTVGVRSVVPLMACFLPAFMAVGVIPIIASLMTDFFG